MLNLVTGYRGTPHITAEDEASKNAGIFGAGILVLEDIGEGLAYSIQSHNSVRILSGDIVAQGRHVRLTGYEDCTIATGTQSLKRNDLICLKYEKDASTGVESISLVVKTGTAAATAEDAEYTAGNILDGDTLVEMPLYRVSIEGLEITSVEALFDIFWAGGTGASMSIKDVTVVTSGWVDETETTALFRYHIESESIRENMTVDVLFKVDDYTDEQASSLVRATNSGVLNATTASAGYVDIYSTAQPDTDLTCDLVLTQLKVV